MPESKPVRKPQQIPEVVTTIEANFRPYYVVNLLWLPTVLIFLAAWILSVQPSKGWGLAAVAMLGIAALILFLLRRALARIGSPALTIDERGIDHWTWGLIPWEQISSIELLKTAPAFTYVFFLIVKVRRPELYLTKVSWFERLVRNRTVRADVNRLELLLNGLSVEPVRVHEAAETMLHRHRHDDGLRG